jgi:rubrerythrin
MISKTEENLNAAFGGESMAQNEYTYFARVACKEGYYYIAKVFEETADNERRHAKDEFALLNGISDTAANLEEAIKGEHYETKEMYPQFADDAEEEGKKSVAELFRNIAKVKAHHRDRYKKLLEMVKSGTAYKREKPIKWKCSICGYVHEGTQPPDKCPPCNHPMEYYEPANMDI